MASVIAWQLSFVFLGGFLVAFLFWGGSHRFFCPLHTLCFSEHNSYRTSVQRHPRAFYALPSSFHLQQVYLAEQSELQVPWSHERQQRQQLIFRLMSLPDTLWVLQENKWDVVRSSFPLGQRSVCNPFALFSLKANDGYTLFQKNLNQIKRMSPAILKLISTHLFFPPDLHPFKSMTWNYSLPTGTQIP